MGDWQVERPLEVFGAANMSTNRSTAINASDVETAARW